MAGRSIHWAYPAGVQQTAAKQAKRAGTSENQWVVDALTVWAADSEVVAADPGLYYQVPTLSVEMMATIGRMHTAGKRRDLNVLLFLLHTVGWQLWPAVGELLWEPRQTILTRIAKGRRIIDEADDDLPRLLASLPAIPPSPDLGPLVSASMVSPRYVVPAGLHAAVLRKAAALDWSRSRALTAAVSEALWRCGLDSFGARRPQTAS